MGLASSLQRVALAILAEAGVGPRESSPEAPARGPQGVPDFDAILLRQEEHEQAIAELASLPQEWKTAVRDMDDLLERLELKRTRLAATESRLRRTQAAHETQEEAVESGGGNYAAELARAAAASRAAGLG